MSARRATSTDFIDVIVNLAAGTASMKLLDEILACFPAKTRESSGMAVKFTTGPGDAERFAEASRANVIVAAGGDGTINEVINGMRNAESSLALIPFGTANLLATEIGLTRKPHLLSKTLQAMKTQSIWLAKVNGRRFSVVASVGLDARAVAGVSLTLKRFIGKAAYVLSAISGFILHDRPEYSVTIDGVTHKCGAVIIAKGRYYAGRFVCVPEARIGGNDLYACLMHGCGRMDMVKYGWALLRGRLCEHPGVSVIRCRKIHIGGPIGEPVQADGDIAASLPVEISIDDKPLQLVVPPDYEFSETAIRCRNPANK